MGAQHGVGTLEKTGYAGAREDVLAVVPRTAHRILDVGCARGDLGFALKQRDPGTEVMGVEMSPTLARYAKAQLDRVLVGTVEETLPELPDGYFDCIIFADVLEHLVNPHQLLADIRQKLAESGVIVTSIPNVRHQRVMRMLVLQGQWEYGEGGLLDSGHLRFFTLAGIMSMFRWAGFEAEVSRVKRVGLRKVWYSNRFIGKWFTPFLDYQYFVTARPLRYAERPAAAWWSNTRSI